MQSGANGVQFYIDQSETAINNAWIVLFKFVKGNKKRIGSLAGDNVEEKLKSVIDIVTELRKAPPPKVLRSHSSAVSAVNSQPVRMSSNGFTPTPLSSIRRTASSDRRKSGTFNSQQIFSASQPLNYSLSSSTGSGGCRSKSKNRLYNM